MCSSGEIPLTFGANPGDELLVLGVVREQVGVRKISDIPNYWGLLRKSFEIQVALSAIG